MLFKRAFELYEKSLGKIRMNTGLRIRGIAARVSSKKPAVFSRASIFNKCNNQEE